MSRHTAVVTQAMPILMSTLLIYEVVVKNSIKLANVKPPLLSVNA